MNQLKLVEVRVDDLELAGMRLDVYVSERLGLFSRSQARSRIVDLRVNGAPARLGKKVKPGDLITLTYTDAGGGPTDRLNPAPDVKPEDIPLEILFENEDVMVIDKPQGMVVHPGSGNPAGTLVNAVLFHCRELAEGFARGDARPGIVHRLDKETSGVIVVAKNARVHEFLARQFQARTVRKRYLALIRGVLPAEKGKIETRIARDPKDRKRFTVVPTGGKSALTHYRVLRAYEVGYSLVSLLPRTGRTHQLRVHMRSLRAPILGDSLYARKDSRFPDATLMLHAHRLQIRLPGEQMPRLFTAPIPRRFRKTLAELQSFSPR